MPERFDTNDSPSYALQAPIHKYLFASKFTSKKIVFDIASGIGYGSNIIENSQKSSLIVAGDNHFEGLKHGKNVYSKTIYFCNLDVFNLPFRDSCCDVFISFETFEHFSDLKSFLSEINRVLKDDGILICSTPNRNFSNRVGIKNEFHVREYTHEELCILLGKYFKKIKSYGQYETASDLIYRYPKIYQIYKIFRPILARAFTGKNPIVISKNLNPKFKVKEFWSTSPYLIFVAKK